MLAVSHLSQERYFAAVFEPVDFRLGPGELLRITGPNGSGKTTLLRLLAGILTPSSGKVEVNARSRSYIGHSLAVKDDLNVTENLRFAARMAGLRGASIAAAVELAIDRLGLRHVVAQPARSLSAGQRRRCALARLLLDGSELWLLDEPYANLDDQGTEVLDGLLRDHCDRRGACVLATHGRHRPPVRASTDLPLTPGPRGRLAP